MKKTKKKILIAFGTRPEAIKFVPLIHALNASPHFETYVCLTGQHRQMVDQVNRLFRIKIDEDLCLMRANQTLAYVSGRSFPALARSSEDETPILFLFKATLRQH